MLWFDNIAGSLVTLFYRNDLFLDADAEPISGGSFGFPTENGPDLTTATMNGQPGGVETTSSMEIATLNDAPGCYFQIQAVVGTQTG
jgi:hypothetical protein